jgi:hypothetical protein
MTFARRSAQYRDRNASQFPPPAAGQIEIVQEQIIDQLSASRAGVMLIAGYLGNSEASAGQGPRATLLAGGIGIYRALAVSQ